MQVYRLCGGTREILDVSPACLAACNPLSLSVNDLLLSVAPVWNSSCATLPINR